MNKKTVNSLVKKGIEKVYEHTGWDLSDHGDLRVVPISLEDTFRYKRSHGLGIKEIISDIFNNVAIYLPKEKEIAVFYELIEARKENCLHSLIHELMHYGQDKLFPEVISNYLRLINQYNGSPLRNLRFKIDPFIAEYISLARLIEGHAELIADKSNCTKEELKRVLQRRYENLERQKSEGGAPRFLNPYNAGSLIIQDGNFSPEEMNEFYRNRIKRISVFRKVA